MKEILTNIHNIIFDLGDVIVPINTKKTVAAFDRLFDTETDQYYSYLNQVDLFSRLETGRITPEQFRKEIRELMGVHAEDEAIDRAWCAMLYDIPQKKLDLLSHLKDQYRTFVLSNTNAIHIRWINAFMQEHYQQPGLEPYFEEAHYSHVIGYRKPNAEAFEFVTGKHQLVPSQTLFIDDKEENIATASGMGLQVFHMTNPDQFYELFG